MYLCSCSCRRAGSRSASIHSDSVLRIEHAVHRRQEHGGRARREIVPCDDVARELVVGAILDDELHLVVRRERVEIRPVVPVRFAAARDTSRRRSCTTPAGTRAIDAMAAGLEHHGRARAPSSASISGYTSSCSSGSPPVISTSGQSCRSTSAHDLVERHASVPREGVRRVAPRAAQVARRQPDEHARPPGAGRLALNRVEDLVDRQHLDLIYSTSDAWRLRIGTSGWNYPTGKGTWNGIFYPPARRRARRGFDELAFYAEHFDTVEVNSTFYGQPRADGRRAVGGAHARRLRVLGQALSEVHASRDVQGSRVEQLAARRHDRRSMTRLARAIASRTQADLDEFRRGIDPLASAASSARCWRSFRRASRTAPITRLPRAPAAARSPATRWPSSCGTAAGATRSATRWRC